MVYLKLVWMAFFWGGTFVAGRMLGDHLAPANSAFLRFGLSALLFLTLLFSRERRFTRVSVTTVFVLIGLGLSGVLAYNLFFFAALKDIEASRAATIIALNPCLIGIGAGIFLGEPLRLRNWIGTLLALLGALMVISRGHPEAILRSAIGHGELLTLGCVVSWVTYSLGGRVVMKRVSPLVATSYSSTLGAIFLLPIAWLDGVHHQVLQVPLNGWLAIFFLAVFGTVLGFLFYYEGIERVGAANAALFINLVPVFAMLLGWLLLNEKLEYSLASGSALVILGILTSNGVWRRLFQKMIRG